MIKQAVKKILNSLPYISYLNKELTKYRTWYPPGHYYSPLVSRADIEPRVDQIFDMSIKDVPGIDMNEKGQLAVMEELKAYYRDMPFPETDNGSTRYFLSNGIYPYADGIFLYSMMRHYKPKRIIEVGSGHSSAVMLDTNERFFNNEIELTFIEPYPERLYSLLSEKDKQKNIIEVKPIQDLPLSYFDKLEAGDFLFIDSTHVSKTGSDVNYLFFEIIPRLKSGVFIHVHDVFTPFEYPKDWVMRTHDWFGFNEIYILRAFLMFNPVFEIVVFNTFLEHHHRTWFKENMPLCLENDGGSIWIKRK